MELRNQKGINIITLSVAIIILVLITSVLVYNSKDGVRIRNLKDLYNDVESLDNKIASYYIEHGDIPKLYVYNNIDFLNNANYEEINPNDGEDYYVIDLAKLQGVTLNYGKDYSKIDHESEADEFTDLYIINEVSHTIYYPRGVNVQGKRYYTYGEEWKKVDINIIPIETAEQFAKIGSNEDITVNGIDHKFTSDGTYVLKNDIDLSSICYKVDETTDNDKSWTPLCGNEENAFTGKIYGNGHEIRGLYINTKAQNQGLFGFNNGIIQNITIEGNVTSTSNQIAGIVGLNKENGKIINCDSKVVVTGSHIIGGIAGDNYGNINNCKNYKKIEGTIENSTDGCTGGIVGFNRSTGNIEKSYNEGQIIAKSNCIGGIAGVNSGIVNSSINNCIVKSNGDATGGITGYQAQGDEAKTLNCYNLKEISNSRYTGGIIGNIIKGHVLNCYSIGIVNGTTNVKSIMGGKSPTDTVARNNFYLNTLPTTDENATPKTMEEMKLQAFVDILNQGQPDQPWSVDTKGINDGYPVLKWQLEELK